jgi:hypothetical protein
LVQPIIEQRFKRWQAAAMSLDFTAINPAAARRDVLTCTREDLHGQSSY